MSNWSNNKQVNESKTKQKMPNIDRNNLQFLNNIQVTKVKSIHRVPPKYNNEVEKQRQIMIVSSSKVSQDAPQWLKGTIRYFYKDGYPKISRQSQFSQRSYDVLNQKKSNSSRNSYYSTLNNSQYSNYNRTVELPSINPEMITSFNRKKLSGQVSPKVGSLDKRDYSYKRTALKIGSQSYVDTYSIF